MEGVPFRLYGWRTVEVAGKCIAQAVFVETRTGGEKPLSPAERNFVRQAREAGAFVGSAIRIQGRATIAEIGEAE